MSKNPFGQLTIRRDDDDEETPKTVQHTTGSSDPLFKQKEAEKKKKVRPEEIKKEIVQPKEDNLEGFETVGKIKQKTKTKGDNEEQQDDRKDRKPKNKGAFDHKPVKEGKRQFERQSGTGRGKEIAKDGAGGHHTWGSNPKQIARDAQKEDYYSNDDKWFRNALSEKKPEEVQEVKVVIEEEPQKEEVKQEEVAPQEYRERRKKKGEEEEEENKEEDLERPENALSLTEYKELLKQKNQGLNSQPKNVVKANETDAQIKTREENQFVFGLTTEDKKKDKKIKEKKVDSREKDITASVVVNLKTDDGNSKERNYGKQGKKGGKFHFDANEFPEL
jgi:hypothetical protein